MSVVEVEPHPFDMATSRLNAKVLPLTPGIFARAVLLDWEHRDPADRLLVQSVRETPGVEIHTRDAKIVEFCLKMGGERARLQRVRLGGRPPVRRISQRPALTHASIVGQLGGPSVLSGRPKPEAADPVEPDEGVSQPSGRLPRLEFERHLISEFLAASGELHPLSRIGERTGQVRTGRRKALSAKTVTNEAHLADMNVQRV